MSNDQGQGGAITPTESVKNIRHELAQFADGSRDHLALADVVAEMQAHVHLVTPAPTFPKIPEGFSVSLFPVLVDVADETYTIPGGSKLGLGKVALNKIAAAAGITWNPNFSRRMDDASDPHYCHYKAVGAVMHFDGTPVVIQGEKVMDVRDGSPVVEAIIERAKAKGKDPMRQIRELRTFILEHAETKAKNRAIRSLGIQTSYSPQALRKPFLIAKLGFTGETDDPEMRRTFSMMRAQRALGGAESMFGPRELPGPAVEEPGGLLSPPPVAESRPDPDDVIEDEPREQVVEPAKAKAKPKPSQRANAADLQNLTVPKTDAYGEDAGKTFADASPETIGKMVTAWLAWLANKENFESKHRGPALSRVWVALLRVNDSTLSALIDRMSDYTDKVPTGHALRAQFDGIVAGLLNEMAFRQDSGQNEEAAASDDLPPGF